MNTLADLARSAVYENGFIVVRMESGVEIRFSVAENPRLAQGTLRQLKHIEISPFGLHWPDLDEDLAFRGLHEGNYGQPQKKSPGSLDNKHYQKVIAGRPPDGSGQIREKRGAARAGKLRKKFGVGLVKSYRSEAKSGAVRKTRAKSLVRLIKRK